MNDCYCDLLKKGNSCDQMCAVCLIEKHKISEVEDSYILNVDIDSCLRSTQERLKEFLNKQDNLSTSNFDHVKQPKHYAGSQIETILYIKDKLTKDGFEGYLNGNIMKYISRYKLKNGVEDLKKAQVYLQWMIQFLETGDINVNS